MTCLWASIYNSTCWIIKNECTWWVAGSHANNITHQLPMVTGHCLHTAQCRKMQLDVDIEPTLRFPGIILWVKSIYLICISTTDRQTDRRRCIRAHRATCTGGLNNEGNVQMWLRHTFFLEKYKWTEAFLGIPRHVVCIHRISWIAVLEVSAMASHVCDKWLPVTQRVH